MDLQQVQWCKWSELFVVRIFTVISRGHDTHNEFIVTMLCLHYSSEKDDIRLIDLFGNPVRCFVIIKCLL